MSPSCSKVYVDEFVEQVSRVLVPGLVYRHITLTLPQQLRKYFYNHREDRKLLSKFMRCGYECLEDVISYVKKQNLKIGVIVVVQTHGRSAHYNGKYEQKEKRVRGGGYTLWPSSEGIQLSMFSL